MYLLKKVKQISLKFNNSQKLHHVIEYSYATGVGKVYRKELLLIIKTNSRT